MTRHLVREMPHLLRLGGQTLSLFNLLSAPTPLVLELSIQAHRIHILGPPLAPAGEEDLLRVSGDIVASECLQKTLGSYSRC